MDNTAAIAWVEQWYSTPDPGPLGAWEAFEAEVLAQRVTFPVPWDWEEVDWESASWCR